MNRKKKVRLTSQKSRKNNVRETLHYDVVINKDVVIDRHEVDRNDPMQNLADQLYKTFGYYISANSLKEKRIELLDEALKEGTTTLIDLAEKATDKLTKWLVKEVQTKLKLQTENVTTNE